MPGVASQQQHMPRPWIRSCDCVPAVLTVVKGGPAYPVQQNEIQRIILSTN